jgi:F420-non-reducing hydrogenase iron-sulfur subunit
VRTPCTGRLDVDLFLRAFENGADGVIVAGCEEGSCHFKEGNLVAKRRVNYTRQLLAEMGWEKERMRMVNIGAADAAPFVEILKDMVDTIKKLGPSPLKKNKTTAEEIRQ